MTRKLCSFGLGANGTARLLLRTSPSSVFCVHEGRCWGRVSFSAHFWMPFLMSWAGRVAFELVSLGWVENYAEPGNRAGTETSLDMPLDFTLITSVTWSSSVQGSVKR